MNGKLQTRQPYRLGLQIPPGMDNEVSVSSAERRGRPEMSGTAEGNSNQQRDADLCGVDQSRSRAYADRDSTAAVCIQGGAVPEGQELTPAVIGIQAIKEAVLGSALMGKRVLGSNERKCDR